MAATLETEEDTTLHARKPFKVSGFNQHFKGVVAGSLSELKIAACRSLHISNDAVRVFLDEDMTEVDDEDYFHCLPVQSKFRILTDSEMRSSGVLPISATSGHLERSESYITHSQDVVDGGTSCLDSKVKERMLTDPVFYLSLNDEDLEKVISLAPEIAARELQKARDEIVLYQESCEREISRRSELRKATELLHLYKRAKSSQVVTL